MNKLLISNSKEYKSDTNNEIEIMNGIYFVSDIRLMKDFDKNTLDNEIGLRPFHCSLFMRKIRIFLNENTFLNENPNNE